MKNSYKLLILLVLPLIATSCRQSKAPASPFTFKGTMQGIELTENGKPVFFYQKEPRKSTTGDYICENYLHPLFTPGGDTLTELFPADHPYHTGIFWTWHQLYQGDHSLGDGWVMDGITKDVVSASTETDQSSATLKLDVLWRSKYLGTESDSSFMDEYTTIIVHKSGNGIRKIDFTIILKPLIPDFSLGGSDDAKGYGGLCARVKLPNDLTFTSTGGQVIPQTLQITAGPWMDFSGTFGQNSGKSGLAILCHPGNPNYPAPWILRQVTSMQNVVYPGRERVSIPMAKPVILHYRLIAHDGDASQLDLTALQKEYAQIKY